MSPVARVAAAALAFLPHVAWAQTCPTPVIESAARTAMNTFKENGMLSARGTVAECYGRARSFEAICACSSQDLTFLTIDILATQQYGYPRLLDVDSFKDRHTRAFGAIGISDRQAQFLLDELVARQASVTYR